jgi:hypothetical protein
MVIKEIQVCSEAYRDMAQYVNAGIWDLMPMSLHIQAKHLTSYLTQIPTVHSVPSDCKMLFY